MLYGFPGGVAWGDAAVICPWQLYLAYGNREILEAQYDCMTGWIKWITNHTKLAYDLLLRREYPSWLYPVTKGATTIWEHWDGIMENGDFWDSEMNPFNHYAYGAVADWVYCKAAGIQTLEEYPGYEKVKIAPLTDDRLDWMEARLKTRHGQIRSRWQKQENRWRYDLETPVEAVITIGEKEYHVEPGKYVFFG